MESNPPPPLQQQLRLDQELLHSQIPAEAIAAAATCYQHLTAVLASGKGAQEKKASAVCLRTAGSVPKLDLNHMSMKISLTMVWAIQQDQANKVMSLNSSHIAGSSSV